MSPVGTAGIECQRHQARRPSTYARPAAVLFDYAHHDFDRIFRATIWPDAHAGGPSLASANNERAQQAATGVNLFPLQTAGFRHRLLDGWRYRGAAGTFDRFDQNSGMFGTFGFTQSIIYLGILLIGGSAQCGARFSGRSSHV